MAVVTPAQVSFNAGELSPRLAQRIDQNVRSISVKTMNGWLPLLQGPAEACPGTIFVAKAKGAFRAIPYEFNVTQSYLVEAGDLYLRFYTNDVRIETEPGVAYEIAAPWSIDQIRAAYYHQDRDVMWIAHRAIPLQALSRSSADTFTVTPYVLRNGPFEPRNGDRALTVTASGLAGSIAIEASDNLFAPGDVGGLMEIEGGSFETIVAWEAGMVTTAGMLVQSNGNVYQKAGGEERTGTNAPIHVEGTEYDGMRGKDINDKGPYGVAWTYQYNRWGLIRFTAFVAPNLMEAEVLAQLPTTSPTWRWRFGAFSERRGHPEIVGIWQERLVLAKDLTIHVGVAGELDNFALRNEFGDPSRDMAFSIDMPDASAVRWLLSDMGLIAGTATSQHIITQASQGQGAGPGNIDTSTPDDTGVASVRPVRIGGRAIFVQRARSKLIQFAYDNNRLVRAESPNMSRFADHIGRLGLNELAWCQEPERLLWSRLDNGQLAVCAYDPDEQLLAWATRTLGDDLTATTIASITDPEGRFPQLWIGAATGDDHWVMRMAPIRATGDTREQIMLDAAVRRTGIPSAAISAPHLAGRTVDVCADGLPEMAVALDADGTAEISVAASDVIVGLRFPAELTFLPPSGGSENGPALGKAKRANRIDLRVINSDLLEIECQGAREEINLLQRRNALDVRRPLSSGPYRLEPRGDVDGEMEVTVRRIYPRPATLAAVIPHYESAQA